MSICSILVIIRKHSEYAVAGLLGVVVTQALGYGLIFDLNFFLRNLSVIGGLLMVLSDSWVRKRGGFAGLPSIDERDRKKYFQLGGRVLLIFLFIGFVFAGEWTFWRVIVSLFGFVACAMVAIGFKAKASAVILVMLLSVFNVLVNNFWTVSKTTKIKGCSLTNVIPSCIHITHTRTSPSTISSRFSPLLEDYYCWSTWVLDNSVWTRKRKFIE